jgi:hypothetical protein
MTMYLRQSHNSNWEVRDAVEVGMADECRSYASFANRGLVPKCNER